MRTALDTNVVSALWSNEPGVDMLVKRLDEAKQAGALLISGVVYAELFAYPRANEAFINDFLEGTGIALDSQFLDKVWIEAGKRFASYSRRRRQAKELGPKRLLADYLIGAHALLQAERLMTLDTSRYKHDFPELRLF